MVANHDHNRAAIVLELSAGSLPPRQATWYQDCFRPMTMRNALPRTKLHFPDTITCIGTVNVPIREQLHTLGRTLRKRHPPVLPSNMMLESCYPF